MAATTHPPDGTRRGPGRSPRALQTIELAGVDNTNPNAHDPAKCATCCGFTPWTEERREAARSAVVGHRIGDLVGVSC